MTDLQNDNGNGAASTPERQRVAMSSWTWRYTFALILVVSLMGFAIACVLLGETELAALSGTGVVTLVSEMVRRLLAE